MNLTISIIITTFNRPDALAMVLKAFNSQTENNFEVIVADDGSTPATKSLIDHLSAKVKYQLKHVWQEDVGFRAAKIRNKAVGLSAGNYLIFLDGDCVPLPFFINKHMKLAQQDRFVVGNRILLSKDFTNLVLNNHLPIYQWNKFKWFNCRIRGWCNQCSSLIILPLGCLRKLKPQSWKGAKTCNLGIWKQDFLEINGFDEEYQGWGYEDSDLVTRLIKNSIKRKSGKYAVPVIHLWHNENDRVREKINYAKLENILKNNEIRIEKGVDQYLSNRG